MRNNQSNSPVLTDEERIVETKEEPLVMVKTKDGKYICLPISAYKKYKESLKEETL